MSKRAPHDRRRRRHYSPQMHELRGDRRRGIVEPSCSDRPDPLAALPPSWAAPLADLSTPTSELRRRFLAKGGA